MWCLAISTSPTTFLVIVFYWFRHIDMYHKSYTLFVDTHSKGDSCYYNLNPVLHPLFLYEITFLGRQSCVIENTANRMGFGEFVYIKLTILSWKTVNDTWFLGISFLYEICYILDRIHLLFITYFIKKIWPIERFLK